LILGDVVKAAIDTLEVTGVMVVERPSPCVAAGGSGRYVARCRTVALHFCRKMVADNAT